MLIAFFIWLSRRLSTGKLSLIGSTTLNLLFTIVLRMVMIVLILLFICITVKGQDKSYTYNIIRDNKIIGKMTVKKIVHADTIRYTSSSQIKTRFFYSIAASTTEESIFYNGFLLQSYFSRVMNGKAVANNNARWNGQNYELIKNGKNAFLLARPVTMHILMLLFSKPANSIEAFSSNYLQHFAIKKIADDAFFVHLPDNTDNTYRYNGDLCTSIEVKGLLFNIKLVLNN